MSFLGGWGPGLAKVSFLKSQFEALVVLRNMQIRNNKEHARQDSKVNAKWTILTQF